MKIALVLFALVAATSAFTIPNIGRGELAKDLQDFVDIMPQDMIMAITLQYFAEDKEFQNMIMYFKSTEFKELIRDVETLAEFKILMDHIHYAGIDIYYLMNKMNEYIGLPLLTPPNTFGIVPITGGIKGYINDIEALLPVEELKLLYKDKLKTSKPFRNFVEQLSSENFQNIVNQVYVNPKFQTLLQHANNAGVDLIRIKNLMKTLLNIDIPSNFAFYRNY